jgi:hypothetical protein
MQYGCDSRFHPALGEPYYLASQSTRQTASPISEYTGRSYLSAASFNSHPSDLICARVVELSWMLIRLNPVLQTTSKAVCGSCVKVKVRGFNPFFFHISSHHGEHPIYDGEQI